MPEDYFWDYIIENPGQSGSSRLFLPPPPARSAHTAAVTEPSGALTPYQGNITIK